MRGVFLVLTSAIALDGGICRAGALVEVTDHEAKNLLARGKARLATDADMPPPEPAAESEAPTQVEPEPEPAAESTKGKGRK